jgi:glycosyltransferase involved in cell wall biosynthesis
VYTVHGYHFLHKAPPPVRWLALKAERVASRRADRVIFVSNHDAKIARAYSLLPDPKRGVVIYNGIPLEGIPRARPSGIKHIGFIGRLEHQKDPLLFLDVLERLPGCSATIVGGGALEDEVRAEVENRSLSEVRVMGALSHHATLEELSKLHAMVATARWEGLPHSPLEAMWAGVPVVATNVGGLGEIIESGRCGLLVDGRSADDLAQAIVRVTEDASLRERVIKNARARVYAMFSEERMLSQVHDVYQQLVTP